MNLRFTLIVFAVISLWTGAWFAKTSKYNFDESAIVGFGCFNNNYCFAASNRAVLPSGAIVYKTGGYDGQFYYYIAADIFSGHKSIVDSSQFRWSRIGYPLLAGWAFLFGKGALVWSMTGTLLIFHLLALYVIFFYQRFLLRQGDIQERDLWPLYFLAFNPFSLLSFLLDTSDGLALNMGVMGIIFYQLFSHKESKNRIIFLGLSFFTISFSLLCKETLLVIPLGAFCGTILNFSAGRKKKIIALLYWVLVLVPLASWWYINDFSPLMAARRGTLPFQGLLGYLKDSDAIYSARSLLVLLLPFLIVTGVSAIYYYFRSENKRKEYSLGIIHFGLMIIGSIILISFATSVEYWSNFANIGRLFTPVVLALLFLAGFKPLPAILGHLLKLSFFLLSVLAFIILQNEITRTPLPFVVY